MAVSVQKTSARKIGKGKSKVKIHPRTGHEGPEGE